MRQAGNTVELLEAARNCTDEQRSALEAAMRRDEWILVERSETIEARAIRRARKKADAHVHAAEQLRLIVRPPPTRIQSVALSSEAMKQPCAVTLFFADGTSLLLTRPRILQTKTRAPSTLSTASRCFDDGDECFELEVECSDGARLFARKKTPIADLWLVSVRQHMAKDAAMCIHPMGSSNVCDFPQSSPVEWGAEGVRDFISSSKVFMALHQLILDLSLVIPLEYIEETGFEGGPAVTTTRVPAASALPHADFIMEAVFGTSTTSDVLGRTTMATAVDIDIDDDDDPRDVCTLVTVCPAQAPSLSLSHDVYVSENTHQDSSSLDPC